MMKIALLTIAAILCAKAITTNAGCSGMDGRKVYLIADNGQRLARCKGCGPGAYSDSAAVHGKAGETFAMWTLESVGKNRCALKSDDGYYAARCEGCWKGGAYADSVFVHVPRPDGAYAQWTMDKHGNLYSFKSDTGKYMARCNSCVNGGAKPNFAFVHSDSPTGVALWKIVNV